MYNQRLKPTFLAPTPRTWYYPVDNLQSCQNEPINQKRRKGPLHTASSRAPLRQEVGRYYCDVAAKGEPLFQFLNKLMLPQAKRLTRDDFTQVTKGKRAITGHFSLSYKQTPFSKGAVVVSKKVAKKATERHLLKRRVLAVVSKGLPPQTAVIVYARAGSGTLSFSSIKTEITELLTKAVLR